MKEQQASAYLCTVYSCVIERESERQREREGERKKEREKEMLGSSLWDDKCARHKRP